MKILPFCQKCYEGFGPPSGTFPYKTLLLPIPQGGGGGGTSHSLQDKTRKQRLTNSPLLSRSYITSILWLGYSVLFSSQDIWRFSFCSCRRGPIQQLRCRHHQSASRSFHLEENDICTGQTLAVSCRGKLLLDLGTPLTDFQGLQLPSTPPPSPTPFES